MSRHRPQCLQRPVDLDRHRRHWCYDGLVVYHMSCYTILVIYHMSYHTIVVIYHMSYQTILVIAQAFNVIAIFADVDGIMA